METKKPEQSKTIDNSSFIDEDVDLGDDRFDFGLSLERFRRKSVGLAKLLISLSESELSSVLSAISLKLFPLALQNMDAEVIKKVVSQLSDRSRHFFFDDIDALTGSSEADIYAARRSISSQLFPLEGIKIGPLLKSDTRSEKEFFLDFLKLKSQIPSELVFDWHNPSVLPIVDDSENAELATAIRDTNHQLQLERSHISEAEIDLLNLSYCPVCEGSTSFQHIVEAYYDNLTGSENFAQENGLIAVTCNHCNSRFQPTVGLIIKPDKGTRLTLLSEIDVLCQTEAFYQAKGKDVLSRKKQNIIVLDEHRVAILNDTDINDLKEIPEVLVNLLAHSPAAQLISFIQQKNIKQRDVLFATGFHKSQLNLE